MTKRKKKGPICTKTLKDLNLIEFNLKAGNEGGRVIRFKPEDVAKIEALIKKDGKFLETQGLLDYSLLVVIERVEQKSESDLLLAKEVAKSSPNTFLS